MAVFTPGCFKNNTIKNLPSFSRFTLFLIHIYTCKRISASQRTFSLIYNIKYNTILFVRFILRLPFFGYPFIPRAFKFWVFPDWWHVVVFQTRWFCWCIQQFQLLHFVTFSSYSILPLKIFWYFFFRKQEFWRVNSD